MQLLSQVGIGGCSTEYYIYVKDAYKFISIKQAAAALIVQPPPVEWYELKALVLNCLVSISFIFRRNLQKVHSVRLI